MSLTSRPRRHPDAVYKIVDGEALIVVPGSEAEHLVLNEVGARAWELLDGDHDLERICEQLTMEFDVADLEIILFQQSLISTWVANNRSRTTWFR